MTFILSPLPFYRAMLVRELGVLARERAGLWVTRAAGAATRASKKIFVLCA